MPPATMHAADINATIRDIGSAGRYMAGTISWNDGQRGVQGGELDCFGSNITDACMVGKDGEHFPFVRSHNMDERLGVLPATALTAVDREGQSVDLQTILNRLPEEGKTMFGELNVPVLEAERVVVRMQTCFIPLGEEGQREYCPAHFSYQTSDADDPRNLLIVCTPTGYQYNTDKPGTNKLLGQRTFVEGGATEHWFRARAASDVKAGSLEEEASPPNPVGVRGMRGSADTFLVVSVPLKQKRSVLYGDEDVSPHPVYRSLGSACEAHIDLDDEVVGVASKRDHLRLSRAEKEPIVVSIMRFVVVKGGTSLPASHLARAIGALDGFEDLVRAHGGPVCQLSQLPVMLHKMDEAYRKAMVAVSMHRHATVAEGKAAHDALGARSPSRRHGRPPLSVRGDPFQPIGNAVAMVCD